MIHQFKYNIHEFGDPLERFGSQQFNKGIPAMLAENGYKQEEQTNLYTVYGSAEKDFYYLLVMPLADVTLAFYIKDDASLHAWKQKYGTLSPALALKTFSPPEPRPFSENTTVIPMNPRALRGVL